jgi:hypothetical protein
MVFPTFGEIGLPGSPQQTPPVIRSMRLRGGFFIFPATARLPLMGSRALLSKQQNVRCVDALSLASLLQHNGRSLACIAAFSRSREMEGTFASQPHWR